MPRRRTDSRRCQGPRLCGVGGRGISQPFQEGQDWVRRPIALRRYAGRRRVRQRAFLQPHVGVEVHLGRLRGFVAEPERDHAQVDAAVQQRHRGGLPQGVRRDDFLAQRGTGPTCGHGVPYDEALERIGAEAYAARARKHRIGWGAWRVREPVGERRRDIGSQRRGTGLSTFADTPNVRAGLEGDILPSEPRQLAIPQPGLRRDEQQCPIAPADPGGRVRCGDERGDLIVGEKRDGASLAPFRRNREDALAVQTAGGLLQGGVAKEAVECRQSLIAGARVIVAIAL